MACLVAPAAVAVATTFFKKKIPAKYHIEWLSLMLWGGTAMLLVDHIKSGEIVWYFPFFTKGWTFIWKELLAVGIPMTVAAIVLWAILVLVVNIRSGSTLRSLENN